MFPGNGAALEEQGDAAAAVADLCENREGKNRDLLASLREDGHSSELLHACRVDHSLHRSWGHVPLTPLILFVFLPRFHVCMHACLCFCLQRMGETWRVDECDLSSITLSPRFGIEQGLRADGTPKLRPVDDFTSSGCNIATFPGEKLVYESLDHFLAALRRAGDLMGDGLSMWKADIDSAYRRIPVLPAHRPFAWVVFLWAGCAFAAQHVGLPFGSVASVHHWNRIGQSLRRLHANVP